MDSEGKSHWIYEARKVLFKFIIVIIYYSLNISTWYRKEM